jgi:hypothetical protein
MYATGYPLRRLRTRRPSKVELALALSVIAGLAFVTMRVKNMALLTPTVEQSVPVARADTTPPAPDAGPSKTP